MNGYVDEEAGGEIDSNGEDQRWKRRRERGKMKTVKDKLKEKESRERERSSCKLIYRTDD